jgi:hypothetical protein
MEQRDISKPQRSRGSISRFERFGKEPGRLDEVATNSLAFALSSQCRAGTFAAQTDTLRRVCQLRRPFF